MSGSPPMQLAKPSLPPERRLRHRVMPRPLVPHADMKQTPGRQSPGTSVGAEARITKELQFKGCWVNQNSSPV
jgi:hypothetical protein